MISKDKKSFIKGTFRGEYYGSLLQNDPSKINYRLFNINILPNSYLTNAEFINDYSEIGNNKDSIKIPTVSEVNILFDKSKFPKTKNSKEVFDEVVITNYRIENSGKEGNNTFGEISGTFYGKIGTLNQEKKVKKGSEETIDKNILTKFNIEKIVLWTIDNFISIKSNRNIAKKGKSNISGTGVTSPTNNPDTNPDTLKQNQTGCIPNGCLLGGCLTGGCLTNGCLWRLLNFLLVLLILCLLLKTCNNCNFIDPVPVPIVDSLSHNNNDTLHFQDSKKISITVNDWDLNDKDRITILVNNKVIAKNMQITNSPQSLEVEYLQNGNNILEIAPTSFGKGACTVVVEVGDNKNIYRFKCALKKGETVIKNLNLHLK